MFRKGRTGYDCGATGARALLAGAGRPDAVFCVTDLIACGFMDVARQEFRMRIPEDLCVIGFDDIEQARWGSYGLTTFAPPVDDLAARVVEMLALPKGGFDNVADSILKPALVWRSSVRP